MKLLRELLFPLIAVAGRVCRRWHLDPPDRRQPDRSLQAADRQCLLLAGWHWLHALLCHAADLHRPGGAGRFSLWTAQHWRRGSTLRCRVCHCLGGHYLGATFGRGCSIPLCFLAAIVAGGVWGAIPGILKARFGSHEVINTIMLNFIGDRAGQLLHSVSLQEARRSDHADVLRSARARISPGSASSFRDFRNGYH